ncbi:MAG: hypothetical protein IJG64_02885 [Oscillospiraceae bacterium]|nr:hypothetical protein [Oscillospiraceae bacterium]
MTPEEAKRFYFEYNGFSFHMGREEPSRYNAFRALDIDPDTLKRWDEELIRNSFEKLWSDPERAWAVHGTILDIIRRKNCDVRRELSRLLGEMEKMDSLSCSSITLILENMAGRTESLKDGGVILFSGYPSLGVRMQKVTDKLIAAGIATGEADERFRKAAGRYRSACTKWL